MGEQEMAGQTRDWRALLVRYMAKVIDRESVTLADSHSHCVQLTSEELEVLEEIEVEARRIADG